MFSDDQPIKDPGQDRLGRVGFSETLARSITDWSGQESLVIALYGPWGSGKSSVVNLCKTALEKLSSSVRPTVIEFNPWFFSGEENLTEHFFNELAKELSIKNDGKDDQQLAEKLRVYSRLFGLLPASETFDALIYKVLVVAGVLGLSAPQILSVLKIESANAKITLSVIGAGLLLLSLSKTFLERVADYFEQRSKTKDGSILGAKQNIVRALKKRAKKILIVLDDIDRLTPDEVRMIFKLVKINTDFPNVLFLLSFDRDVVCKALSVQPGINGEDYIEKIVQVSFDVPFVKHEKVATILFEELDRILAKLPESGSREPLFDQTYWGNIYHGGLKYFFKNIRDVKRYASALEFNVSLLYKDATMEVNPVDFIGIEAIRVFLPGLYAFIRVNKELFTSIDRERHGGRDNTRAKEIQDQINLCPEKLREPIKDLLGRLFPQLSGVFSQGYSTYGSEWITTWNRALRVCSPEFFDTYFTLIPGGDESEISQYEMDALFSLANNPEQLEEKLRVYIPSEKIRKILTRLESYTSDTERLPKINHANVIQALFNISDDLSYQRRGMFDFGSDMQVIRIVYQLLRQNPDKDENAAVLLEAVQKSKSVYGPVYDVALESQKDEEGKTDAAVVPDVKLKELQAACLEKIRGAGQKLLDNSNLASIMYRWKDWASDETEWKAFVHFQFSDPERLLRFLKSFVGESMSQSLGDHVGRKKKSFNYKSLATFVSLDDVKAKLEGIKTDHFDVYQAHKETIDLFLNGFGKKDEI